MKMAKYVMKRLVLMLFVLFVITTVCFMLVRILPRPIPEYANLQKIIEARWEALGYNKPLLVQYGIYLKNHVFVENHPSVCKTDNKNTSAYHCTIF